MSSAPDLADLLKACGRGDEASFAQLYDATSSRVVGLAVRVVRDPAQAEEVAQEAFLEIWKTSGRFDPAKGSPLGWLLTIVHRKAVDRVRSAEAVDPARHDVPPAEPAGRARLDRRGRHCLTRGSEGPRGPRQPHRRPAGGAGAGLLRRLHAHGGGDHARAPGRHRQDPHQRRTHQTTRHHGGGLMTGDIHALSGAYAVDALDDIERAQFERHLAECPACRARSPRCRRQPLFSPRRP